MRHIVCETVADDYNIRPQDVSSENLENLNNGNHCVMLMLCLRIACIHVLPVKAIPEPSLEVVCLHASFLDGFRSGFKTELICQKSRQ